VKIEKRTADVFKAVDECTEAFEFIFIAIVNGEIDEKRWMGGALNVVNYPVEGSTAKRIVGFLKPVNADEHGVGGCLYGDRSVGIDDNREKSDALCVVDDVFNA
jgi:hypothetical protein